MLRVVSIFSMPPWRLIPLKMESKVVKWVLELPRVVVESPGAVVYVEG